MSVSNLYIYGIMADPAPCPAGPGLGGAPVGLVTAGDLVALVSENVATPIARTRRNMLAHTAVLEQAMALGTVLPLRFGTVAPHAYALIGCMNANAKAFKAELADIDGRIEMGLKASWRDGMGYADIIEHDAGLRQLRDRLETRPAAETYYERIELGRRVEAALAERGAAWAAAIAASLAPLAERQAELPAQETDMVLNRAFLLPRAREAAFDAAVEQVAQRFGDSLKFRYVGPVPPFNFVSLHADWLGPAAP